MPKIYQNSSPSVPPGRPRDVLADFHQQPVVKLHEAVQPQFLGLTSFRAREVKVKDSTIQNLMLAQEALLKTKHVMPYGAGNQKTDTSHTKGESWARTGMVRDYETYQTPVQYAGEAARYQAGNCAEHASVSYAVLASKNLDAPLLRVSDNARDHAYVLIGDPRDRRWGEKDTVVVDAWVTHPCAVTLDQSTAFQPKMPPAFQQSPHSPDPDALIAFDGVLPVKTEEVNDYLEEEEMPNVGDDLMAYIDAAVETSDFLHERVGARDPSTRYSSSAFPAESADRILVGTVQGQNLAHASWQNNGYRW